MAVADQAIKALAITYTILSYISYPVVKLAYLVAYILAPFWSLAQFILLPVTYTVHGILTLALIPFRLHLLERLEVRRHCINALHLELLLNVNITDYIHISGHRGSNRVHRWSSPLPRYQRLVCGAQD